MDVNQSHRFYSDPERMYPGNWPLKSPPEPDEPYRISSFVNALPQTQNRTYTPVTRHDDACPRTRPSRPKTKSLTWPAVIITLPLLVLSGALLGLVFGYQVKKQQDVLSGDDPTTRAGGQAYVLVNFSATRLVFAASFLSTVAPLLTSSIMGLWGLMASNSMSLASRSSNFNLLPTPYQLSILIGLCLASLDQLRTYIAYACSRKRATEVPPVLNKAGLILILTICLAAAVFVSDTALHYLTSTIVFDRIHLTDGDYKAYGYGLSQSCLGLDRIRENAGFPCSLPVGLNYTDPDETLHLNEISRLQNNSSLVSQIRATGAAGVDADIAIVMPNPATLDASTDYRATTIGVATKCILLPPTLCNMRVTGNESVNTEFRCSDMFFGMLGKAPNVSSTDGTKAQDPDLSPLAFKPSPNLQFAYFTSANLDRIYNPESWDPETNQPDEKNPLPDDKLLNPFYCGFGTRVAVSAFSDGSTMPESDLVFNDGNGMADFIMSCSVTSYDVDYTWYKSGIRNVSATVSPNGTLLEIFHGNQVYNSVAGAFDMQLNLVTASIAGSDTDTFLTRWQDLFSIKVLSHIGGHSTPRTNLQEQRRESLLVAKVPKSALGALVGSSLVYPVLGVLLVVSASRVNNEAVNAIADQFSLAGLTNMAFGEPKEKDTSLSATPRTEAPMSSSNSDYFGVAKPSSRNETRRVRINGADFQVWV